MRKLISLILFIGAIITFVQGQTTQTLTNFDFETYPTLASIIAEDSDQPKKTGLSNTVRFSVVLPELVCTLGEGRVSTVKLIVPEDSIGTEFILQIWSKNPNDTFTVKDTIEKTLTASGTVYLEDGVDFTNKYMKFNDVAGIWLPWRFPLAVIQSDTNFSQALYIARYVGAGSNLLVQDAPPVGETLEISSATTVYRNKFAIEILLENQNNGPTTIQYATGIKGQPGDKGDQGVIGDVGSGGVTGVKGRKGQSGPKGIQGDAGSPGSAGLLIVGATGTIGAIGPKGEKGLPGGQGATGFQGLVGSTGNTGATGPKGGQGSRGPQGSQGINGSPGPTGLVGNKGERGSTGLPGEQGVQGAAGERGAPGPTGDELQVVLDAITGKCETNNGGCVNSACSDSLVGPVCRCNAGYQFTADSTTECEDMDECSVMKPCQHSCTNSPGSYTCECSDGYTLQSDGKGCVKTVVSTCDTCASNETCHVLTGDAECISSSLIITAGGSSAQVADDTAAAPVPFEPTSWAKEEWVIIFIVWGIVLTVCAILLGVWLMYEINRKISDRDFDDKSHMTSSMGRGGQVILAPPVQRSNGRPYANGGSNFAQLQYPDPMMMGEDIYD